MIQVQHFVSRIKKKRQRWDVQTMWACEIDLWPGNRCAMPILVILRLFVGNLWAIGCGRVSAGARRRRYRSIRQKQLFCSECRNWQITVFRWQNSRYRKRFSKIGLSCNVAVPHWNTACEFGANWYGTGWEIGYANQRYAISSHWNSAGCVSAWMAVWLSGNTLASINVVALRQTRLVLGWVTVCGRVNHLGM